MPTTSVTDYKKDVLIQSLMSDLKRLKDFSLNMERNQVSSRNLVYEIDTILNRIESKSFTLGVVGEFKRVKAHLSMH
jgi:hypothetical protein